MDRKPYLALHILNRVWSHLLKQYDFDSMSLVDVLQDRILNEADPPLETWVVELLSDVDIWQGRHEI